MKLKIKNLNWSAGRPIAVLTEKTAKSLNVFANDRVEIRNKRKTYAIVDIFPKLVKNTEIGLSKELSEIVGKKSGSFVDVKVSELSEANYLIKKKVLGKKLSEKELSLIISEIVHNNLTEAEIAYFTSAEKFIGMDEEEIYYLTKSMIKTGARIKFNGKFIVDKHSIGGVAGNRTTPIVVSILAANGFIFPKTSSRAISSAAGTADVIETLSNVNLTAKEIKKVVKKTNACIAWGGSLGLAPSDDKVIRVERLLGLDIEPQLIASIMSKKIAAGSKIILLDIPYGKGAKIESYKKARSLGRKFKKIAKRFQIKLKVVYTDGRIPIGSGVGPNYEMRDVLLVLSNSDEAPKDLREKSIYLATELMKLCGVKKARRKAIETLESGKAFQKFKEIINAQNNKNDFEKKVRGLRRAKYKKEIKSPRSGKIKEMDNREINLIARILGSPETKSAGIFIHRKLGKVKKGEKIFTFYSESKNKLKDAVNRFLKGKAILIK